MAEIVPERVQRPPIAQQRAEIASLVTLPALEGSRRLLILRLRLQFVNLIVARRCRLCRPGFEGLREPPVSENDCALKLARA